VFKGATIGQSQATGLSAAKGKWGCFSSKGEKIFNCKYDYFDYNRNYNTIRVFIGKTKNLYDYRGEWLPIDGEWQILNAKAELLNKTTYELIGDYNYNRGKSDNIRALVKLKGKFGFINQKGEQVIPCIYNKANAFEGYDNTTKVEKDGEIFNIDINGNKVD